LKSDDIDEQSENKPYPNELKHSKDNGGEDAHCRPFMPETHRVIDSKI
jgi:hypothetical protein